jgi:hypothetical protein
MPQTEPLDDADHAALVIAMEAAFPRIIGAVLAEAHAMDVGDSANGGGLRGALIASVTAEMLAMALKTEAGAAAEMNRILGNHGLPWRLVHGNA